MADEINNHDDDRPWCYACQRVIPIDELFTSVDYSIGHMVKERKQHNGQSYAIVEIDNSETLFITCQDCTPTRPAVAAVLQAAGYPVPEYLHSPQGVVVGPHLNAEAAKRRD